MPQMHPKRVTKRRRAPPLLLRDINKFFDCNYGYNIQFYEILFLFCVPQHFYLILGIGALAIKKTVKLFNAAQVFNYITPEESLRFDSDKKKLETCIEFSKVLGFFIFTLTVIQNMELTETTYSTNLK